MKMYHASIRAGMSPFSDTIEIDCKTEDVDQSSNLKTKFSALMMRVVSQMTRRKRLGL